MEDPDTRNSNRQGKPYKQHLIRIHGGVSIGGLLLFGGAIVATYFFRKTKADQHEEEEEQQLNSNNKEGKHSDDVAATHERTVEDCHGGHQGQMLVDDGIQEIAGEENNCGIDDNGESCSSFPVLNEESSSARNEEEQYGRTSDGKLAADEEIADKSDDDDVNNRKERGGDDGSQASLCATFGSTYEGREREFDGISGGEQDLEQEEEEEEAEAFEPEANPLHEEEEMTEMEEEDEGLPEPAATETNHDEHGTQNEGEVMSKNDEIRQQEEDAKDEMVEVDINCEKTEDGVIEEVDGYIEDNDMEDEIENEEDDSTGSSEGLLAETEKDEYEIWGGSETESNAEAIWPAESIESLAVALEDQMSRLKKSAEEGINNQANHFVNSNENNSSQSEIVEEKEETYNFKAPESTMLLEKPMMVNGQIAELITRRTWLFPMLMLLIVALVLLTRRNASSYQANAI
ncbi:hypothetical protein LINGRAHAP2_LOCUS15159 [Linum grandiflorum]